MTGRHIPAGQEWKMEVDPNSRKGTPRLLSSLVIATSLVAFAMELWDFIQRKARWSKPILAFRLFLSGGLSLP